jgi:hypothetical protein
MRYYIRAGAVVAFHSDNQNVAPAAYGAGTTVIVVPGGSAPAPSDTGFVPVPAITDAVRAASCKDECFRRIIARVTETGQRNLTAYGVLLATLSIAGTIATEQAADLAKLTAVYAWIGRPNGMQGACDAIIAAGGDWSDDAPWPEWNPAWNDLVARF